MDMAQMAFLEAGQPGKRDGGFGVLGRVAPQLNLMAIGFPITIVLGFSALIVSLSYLASPLLQLFEFGLQSMLGYFVT